MSLYERESRLGLFYLMSDKSSGGTLKGIMTLLWGMEVRTITYDSGVVDNPASVVFTLPPSQ